MALTKPENVVALAEQLARRYHAGQVDRLGAAYIEHPRAVAGLLPGAPGAAGRRPGSTTSWSTPMPPPTTCSPTACRPRSSGPRRNADPPPGEDYLAFIERVCADPAAVRVKIADALHNLDPARDFGPSAEQRARYHEALVRLFRANLPEPSSSARTGSVETTSASPPPGGSMTLTHVPVPVAHEDAIPADSILIIHRPRRSRWWPAWWRPPSWWRSERWGSPGDDPRPVVRRAADGVAHRPRRHGRRAAGSTTRWAAR